MIEKFTIPLNCGLCGAKQGEYVVSSEFGWTKQSATAQNLHIVDIRCDACAATHGHYKDLTAEYVSKTKQDAAAAEAFVTANPTRAKFDKALSSVQKDVILELSI